MGVGGEEEEFQAERSAWTLKPGERAPWETETTSASSGWSLKCQWGVAPAELERGGQRRTCCVKPGGWHSINISEWINKYKSSGSQHWKDYLLLNLHYSKWRSQNNCPVFHLTFPRQTKANFSLCSVSVHWSLSSACSKVNIPPPWLHHPNIYESERCF